MYHLILKRSGATLLTLMAGLCTTPSLYAETGAPTLAEAVRAAFARYPEAELVQAIRRQGEAIQQQASSFLAAEPAVMVRHENDAVGDHQGYRQWEGGLEMPLWLPGQRHRRARVADATQGEADATARLQRWKVAGEVRDLLWSLNIAEAELELARQALQSAKALEQDVARRVSAGELARMDLLLAQKETLAREIDRAEAASRHRTQLLQYQTITGLSEVPVELTEQAPAGAAVGDDHPALAARRVVAERSRAVRDQVRGERRGSPVLTLGGKSERPESGFSYDKALVLEVSLPLGTRAHAAPRIAAAERNLAESSAAVARAGRELGKDLIEALNARRQAAQTLKLAERQQRLAAEGLRLARRAFELGENSLFMVLEARRQALDAARSRRVSELELGRAVARLNQTLGVIPE
ncbi:MAG: TolC family protein [Gammaproteobacteria bacterium]|jgi:outer membrane protein TolC